MRRVSINFLVLILFMILLLPSCQEQSLDYHAVMDKCMEQVKTQEFTLEDGRKGLSLGNYKPDCIVGARVPEISIQTIDNQAISNDLLNGKITIVNFWFEACKPCLAEIPGLNKIVESYGTENLNYIAISTDSKDSVIEFLEHTPFAFTHVADGRQFKDKELRIMSGYPTTLVIDQNQKIVDLFTGGRTDERAVQDIIDKLTPTIESLL